MKRLILILTLVFFYACSMKTGKNNSTDSDVARFNNEVLTDSLLAKIPLIKYSSFKFGPESDDNIDGKLPKLNERQINYFYSTDELIKYRDFLGSSSYFYGRLPIRKEMLPILIINTDNSTLIYLDCFLIDKNGRVIGMFNPTYIELSEYSLFSNGSFINDSTYNTTEVSYQPLDSIPNAFIKDSSFIKIRIEKTRIIKDRIQISNDTIIFKE